MKNYLYAFVCTLSMGFFCMPNTAQALGFRCNSYVIDVGMHKAEVMNKCGNPATRDQRVERRRIGGRQSIGNQALPPVTMQGNRNSVESEREIEIQIEEWVYNFGSQRFMQLLTFEDGRLKQIQDLGYGQ
ncbi:DUF2845 domain-containing protein [Undibacterium sp. Di24W]|uniref:DUF2845 domain-containing protein n=1 Tax=Undibacterium sp. Di24W TaxID=3413033 RepID=UPI003BF141FB